MPMKALRINHDVLRKFGSPGTISDKLQKLADSRTGHTDPIYGSKYISYNKTSCFVAKDARVSIVTEIRSFMSSFKRFTHFLETRNRTTGRTDTRDIFGHNPSLMCLDTLIEP